MMTTPNDAAHDATTRTQEKEQQHATAQPSAHGKDDSRVTVPADSGIVGGGTPGEATDIGTASGPSGSGGG